MKTKIFLTITTLFLITSAFNQTIELTFTAIDSAAYVQLDSIKVMNRTQGGEAMIYWPDTILSVEITTGDILLYIGYSTDYPVGIHELNQNMEDFQVFQNYPNPVKDQSLVSLYIPEKGTLNIMVADIQGRLVINDDWQLDEGHHSFRFTPGRSNLFFLTARWNEFSKSIKILTTGDNSGRRCALEYTGSFNGEPPLKASSIQTGFIQESGILDNPDANETYTFQFATNIPCPGTPTVEYEGKVYNTIQVFSQCWLKENLNVGVMIPGELDMTDNDTIEKYCYDNDPANCDYYGGLYQWDETMQYSVLPEAQGICPPGWHLPTDEEWKVLAGAADSQFGIGDQIWDEIGYRGFDAGKNLKTISGWNYGGNGTDIFGFSGLPGGYSWLGIYYNDGYHGDYWSTTKYGYDSAWYIKLLYNDPGVYRFNDYDLEVGFSVRCLKD